MKSIIIISILAGSALLLTSCSDTISSPDNIKSTLMGTWVHDNYSEYNVRIMRKSQTLKKDNYGFIFYRDGGFVERNINGWCGTPPVAYNNYEGEWVTESDSLIKITVEYWGGITEYRIKIISLTRSELKFIHINNERY
ncbi:MAG: hypothetical protein R6W90_03045 [Ignavibacteriaceae bacterium]